MFNSTDSSRELWWDETSDVEFPDVEFPCGSDLQMLIGNCCNQDIRNSGLQTFGSIQIHYIEANTQLSGPNTEHQSKIKIIEINLLWCHKLHPFFTDTFPKVVTTPTDGCVICSLRPSNGASFWTCQKVQNGPRILYETINRGHFFPPIFQISSNSKNAYLAPPRDIKYFWLVENHEESVTYLQFIIRRSLHLQKSWTCCFKIVLINHIIFLSSNSQVQNHLHPLSEAKLRQGITRHFKPTLPDTCHKSLTLSCFSPVLPTASWDLRRGLHVGPAEARRPAGDHPHQEGGFPHTDPVLLLHGEVRMINTQRLYPQSSHSQGSFYSRYRVENTIFMSVQ